MKTENKKYKKKRFRLTPAAYLVLIKKDKILMIRRANTGFEDGSYSLPAGHLDGEESVTQAIIREAKEEVNIDLKPEDLKVAHVMHRINSESAYFDDGVDHSERVDFFLVAEDWAGEIRNMEPEKCDDLKWFDIKNLPANTIDYVRQAISLIEKNIYYSEHGW